MRFKSALVYISLINGYKVLSISIQFYKVNYLDYLQYLSEVYISFNIYINLSILF